MTTSYFAEIESWIVVRVLSVTQDVVDTLPGTWVRTWFLANGDPTKRCNYAGVGYIYDAVLDAFYAPRPYPSWTLDGACKWHPPTPDPSTGADMYTWNEGLLNWVLA